MLVQLNPSALYQKMDAALSVYHLHVLQTAAVYSVLSAVQDQRGVEMEEWLQEGMAAVIVLTRNSAGGLGGSGDLN